MGAFRLSPEARWRRTPNDLANLTPLQRKLLDSALAAVKPGGIVAYATCSPHLAETIVVVEDALRENPEFEQLDAREVIAGIATEAAEAGVNVPPRDPAEFGTGPGAQRWPHSHGTHGMVRALWRRRE